MSWWQRKAVLAVMMAALLLLPYTTRAAEISAATIPCFVNNDDLRAAVQAYLLQVDNHGNAPGDSAASNSTPIGEWCVDQVTDFSYLFQGADTFNDDLSHWNVSAALSMRGMFQNAASFNQALATWDVSRVKDFSSMFAGAKQFAQPLGAWNVRAATNMKAMFANASVQSIDIAQWDVSGVTDMSYMFQHSWVRAFELGNWNTSQIQDLAHFLESAPDFDFRGTVPWDTAQVTDLSFAFMNAANFDGDLTGWNVERVLTMESAFHTSVGFRGRGLEGWHTKSLRNLAHSFQDTWHFNADLSQWDTRQLTDLSAAFAKASAFNADLSLWNVSAVTRFQDTFRGASLFDQDLCHWTATLGGREVDFLRTFAETACPYQTSPYWESGVWAGSICHACTSLPGGPVNPPNKGAIDIDGGGDGSLHDDTDGDGDIASNAPGDVVDDDDILIPMFSVDDDNDNEATTMEKVKRDMDVAAILLAFCVGAAVFGWLVRRLLLRQRIHRRHLEVYSQVQPYDVDEDAVELT